MANLLSNTTVGGNSVITTANIGSYAVTSLSGYATQSWVQSQGYVTGGPYLSLSGGSMSGDIIFPNNTAVALKNADGSAGFRPDDLYGNTYTWNTSGGYYVDANSYYFRSTGSINWMTISGGTVQASADFRAPIFYDSNDTNYYGDFASTSRFNIAHVNSVVDQSYSRIVNPQGGQSLNNGPQSGAIKIKLPVAASFSNSMMSFTIQIYNYSTGTSRTIRCGGYTYYTTDWYNTFAFQIGDTEAGNLTIRFGKDSTGACVWIGETNSYWDYPNVFVTDVQSGHSQPTSMATGWSVTMVTSFDTIQTSRVAYSQITSGNIGSQSVSYASTAGSANSVAWTNVSGRPTNVSSFTNDSGYLTSLPSHNHDDRYFTETESDGRFHPLENQRLSTGNSPSFASVSANDVYTTGGWFRNHTNNSGIYWSNTGWHLMPENSSDFRFHSGNSTEAAIRMESSGTTRGYIYVNSSNEIGFLNNGRSWRLKVSAGGAVESYGDFRAPIFYDSADTNYYVDPNGLSTLSHIRLNNNWANAGVNQGAINIRGQYPSMVFRNTVSDSMWLRHMDGSGTIQHYYASDGVDSSNWGIKHSMHGNGNFSSIGTHTASQFIGSGAGLTGTASSLSVGYATTAGSATTATTAGALSSMNISQFTNNSNYVAYGNYSWTSPVFGQYGIKSNLIDNVLYSAADRFELFKNGVAWNTNCLFNLNYDQNCEVIATSTSRTYSIVLNTKGNDSSGITYTEGSIYLSFYYVFIPGSVSGRVRFSNGNWVSMSGWTNVANSGSYAVWRGNVPGGNYMVEIEITINASSSIDTWFAQWEYVMGRPGQYELGIFNKAQDNSIWRSLYFKDSSNVARVTINSGGINANTVTSNNFNVSNAIYFGGGNNYFNWDGGRINSNVGIQSGADMRAPIFYDSQDSNYYADFNSTVNNAIRVRGGMLMGPNPTWGAYLQVGGDGNNSSYATMSVTNGNIHIDPKNGYNLYLNHYYGSKIYFGSGGSAGGSNHHSNFSGGGNLNLGGGESDASYRLQVSGTGYASSDFRAPIFYDSNDTNYYGDFAGTSRLNNLYLEGGVASVYNASGYSSAAIEVRERNFGGAQDDTWATAPRIGFHWGGRVASQIALASNGRIHILNDPGTANEAFQAGIIYSSGYGDSTQWKAAYDWGNHASAGYISTSYLDDYTRGSYRVISDYGGNTTWYLRGNGQFIWGLSHDWSYSFRLNLPSGSQNNTTWAYFGQQDSNAGSGTWRGVRIRKYASGSVDGDLSAGAFYIGDTRKDQNWDSAYSWGNHASAGYQSASTAITTSNIGSQSVSYASTAGSLSSMNISQFTNNSGYLTGITSGQVTGALGYTPYNSSNPSGYITSSGSISGNAATATYATTAGSAPNGSNINQFYNVSAGVGNGLSFWNGSSAYKISMGVGSLYQYGPVSDYSIKMQMNDGDTGRGFTWGRESHAPIAALNSTSGDMEVAGYYKSYGYRGNGNVGGTGTASWHPDGIYCGSTMWQYGTMYKNNTGIYDVSEFKLNAGPVLGTYNTRNLIVKAHDSNDVMGILGQKSGGGFAFQIYGDGSNYGFLNGAWAGWDIKKTNNGAMYMNNNDSYYLQTNSTSNFYALNIQGSAVVHAGNIGSQSVSYASSAGSVAWTNVSSRPTALSQFSNDLGNYGGWLTTGGKAADSELFDGTDSIYFVKGNGTNALGRTTTNLNGTNSAQGLSSGFYDGTGMSNMPTSDWYHLIVNSHYNSATTNQYEFQLATAFWDKSNFYVRSISPGDVGPWRTLIHNGNIGSQSVNYANSAGSASSATTATTATVASQLNKFGDIYGQDWNSYYIQDKFIASAVYGHSGANRPNLTYDYGVMLSYGETSGPLMQMYFPENSPNLGTIFRKATYRTGWNGNWSTWKTLVEQEGNTCTIVGGNQTGMEIHANVGYNQDPLTYFLLRGQADTSWKALKIRLTGDAGGQDIEFRRIAENGADARMFYVPRGANQVIFEYQFVQGSDSRLKDNIIPITNSLDKVKSLRGVEFDWNSGVNEGTHDVGLIAQDVEAVLPEAVTTQEDGYKNLAYTKVIPLLVEAMKEQQAMIDALKAEIELLKNK